MEATTTRQTTRPRPTTRIPGASLSAGAYLALPGEVRADRNAGLPALPAKRQVRVLSVVTDGPVATVTYRCPITDRRRSLTILARHTFAVAA